MTLPVDRFCNLVYAWIASRVEDVERFDYDLSLPIQGQRVTQSVVEEEKQEFSAFMSAMSTR